VTKVRYKSTAMQILGMDMNEMMGGMGEGGYDTPRPSRGQPASQPRSRSGEIMRGLGGLGGLIRP
jgi:hypothetical protein